MFAYIIRIAPLMDNSPYGLFFTIAIITKIGYHSVYLIE